MSTIPSKQVIKVLAAPVRIAGFSANGGSTVATAALTTALSTAGENGVSVPVQASASNGLGVITTGASNRCELYAATSKNKLLAGNGEEVYARLTEAAGVYTLTYYTLADTGVETAYSFAGATSIDVEFSYRFDFARLPSDAIIAIGTRNIAQDPGNEAGRQYRERLTVTGTNAINALTKAPVDAGSVVLFVNGVSYDSFGGAAAAFAVNTSTKALTWSAANAGFSIETTDRVVAQYLSNE